MLGWQRELGFPQRYFFFGGGDADIQACDMWLGYCLRTPQRSKVPSYSTVEGCKSRNDFCSVAVNWKDLGQYRPWPNRGTVPTFAYSECWSGISVTLWWILGYRLYHFCYPHTYLGVFNRAVFWNVNGLVTKDSCTVTTKMLNLIIVQQDATYSVYYISVGSSTCFRCWHPSSGAGTAVITASGID